MRTRRLVMLLWMLTLVLLLAQVTQPWWQRMVRAATPPRTVTPRGDLAGDERATVELFQEAAPVVVNITNLAVRRDFFSLNVMEVPQGTGSGFLWDDAGHVVTNFHVI